MQTSIAFVPPEEKSTGYTFKRVYDENAKCLVSKSFQTTFQFIPITKTLESLFNDAFFEETYMNNNKYKDHNCGNGNYTNFCCGKVYSSNTFFKSNPSAIQINLFTDDFEPCDPLKSKVGLHKMTAFYFQINNLPQKWLSKTNNIYLVALSDAKDVKNELADVENVINTIILDLKKLESQGIVTRSKNKLKGALVYCSFDNLGGNVLFGFSGGFMANYYCRICTSKRQECQKMVEENRSTLRTRSEYESMIKCLDSNNPPNLTQSKGIKSKCALNMLNNFHVVENITTDFMHDGFEGIVGFTIEAVLNYCVQNKIATIEQLQSLVHSFHYGDLSKSNIPSKLILDKKNVGQNASQARCLILNLPFILFKYKDQLKSIWMVVESLLQIIQILMSDEMNELDLERLSGLIKTHLQCYQLYFNLDLKPKHHFLTHYATVIRSMGPVIRFWAMRMEAKHQFFKRIVYKTRNFTNLKKTLADKHQEKFFVAPSILFDDVQYKAEVPLIECENFEQYYDTLKAMNFGDALIENAHTAKSLKINEIQYKPRCLIASVNDFREIQYILPTEEQILFLCDKSYRIESYDPFLNSFKLVSTDEFSVVIFNELTHIKPYEKKVVDGNIYTIVDCLKVFKMNTN